MAKNSKKNLLPKRIAGVKVPRSVRKGRIGEALASPTGQAVLAELILAAADAAKAADARGGAAANDALFDMADRLQDTGGDKGAKTADDERGAIVYAVGEAARSFVEALNRRRAIAAEVSKAESGEGLSGRGDAADSKKKPPAFEGVPH